ncbi:uncharacterized protein, partial [Euphorbia lathyris]|uniref:uncharacterized protein n=1 Tax=Euphorbia lathyris TaxID=212925 RepID=UPI00331326E0
HRILNKNPNQNLEQKAKWKLFLNPAATQEQGFNSNRAEWRNKLSKFLESSPIRVAAIVLIIVDLILTVLELSSSIISCSSPPENENTTASWWWHWVGIGILSLLCLKAVAEAVGLGGDFFRRPCYVVDGAFVIGALVLEAVLERKGGGLLVVVSLWRVVRVVGTAFELSDEAIQAQIQQIISQFQLLREENTRLLVEIAEKDVLIHNLEEIIHNLNPSSSNHVII